jgi:hypothetical protein
MITRYCDSRNSPSSSQIQVITLSNYAIYQMPSETKQQPEQQPSSSPTAAQQQQYKEDHLTTLPVEESPPLPPHPGGLGGEGAKAAKQRKGLTAAQVRLTDEAVLAWNAAAKRLGCSEVRSVTAARRTRLLRRIEDIGGLDQFYLALSAIERVPFLLGKVPPKPGMAPFMLDIDRLLQTDGNLGDVLAKLIDKAGDAIDAVGPNGKRWGWWRGQEDQLRALPIADWRRAISAQKPNGEWPWWVLTAPPGDPECLMPQALIEQYGFTETYGGKIHHS